MCKQPCLISLSSLLILLALSACGGETDTQATSSGSAAVAFSELPLAATFDAAGSTYQDLDGRGLEIASFAGKKLFINYWATWCAPCIREIPALARAAAELEDENFIFVLASDETPDTIRNFVADRGFTGYFIKLNGFFGGHGIDAVPSSSVYDEQGKLLYTWAGAREWDSAEMLEQIRNPALAQH